MELHSDHAHIILGSVLIFY